MSEIRFHNTLTGRKEVFAPLEKGVVKIYTCGPTVYDFAHIGNFRAYVFEDLLHRFLEYAGYRVKRVMNITDVDDKTIAGALRDGVPLSRYTERYIKAFYEDMETLRLKKADVFPRATEHIPEMVALIKTLLEKGYAYRKDGSIYFRIASFPRYGQLSHNDFSRIKSGTSVDADEYEKEQARDFVLWKAEKENDIAWDTEIGRGRPGWHIECSAMSMKYLGETLDIHTGGVDNIFPHHENEIAQSEAATGKPFVNCWLHCAHLMVNGEKMSKSKGNFYTLRDLLAKGCDPIAIRYLLMTTHYRDPLNFTEASLNQAASTIKNLQAFCQRIETTSIREVKRPPLLTETISSSEKHFSSALGDDLNISAAMAAVFDCVKEANKTLETDGLSADEVGAIKGFFSRVDGILQILNLTGTVSLPKEYLELIEERNRARKEKNYARADEIRKLLEKEGIILEDTPWGTRWLKKQL